MWFFWVVAVADGAQKDIRLSTLGLRFIKPASWVPSDMGIQGSSATPSDYLLWRIKHGVAEGDVEIPSGEDGAIAGIDNMHPVSVSVTLNRCWILEIASAGRLTPPTATECKIYPCFVVGCCWTPLLQRESIANMVHLSYLAGKCDILQQCKAPKDTGKVQQR